ncbi:MAG: phosphatase PAP2 family protein, partial [Patescibacteria group bacterium]
MSKRFFLLILACLMLLFFTLFSRAIKRGGMRELDFATTVKMQERIDNSSRLRLSRLTGEVMEGATFFASPMASTIAVLLLTLITLTKRKKWRIVALMIPLLFGLMTLAEVYGKSVVHHPAPPFFLLKNPTTVFPKYYIWEDYSYPSGHAARAIYLGIILYSYFILHTSYFKQRGIKAKMISIGILSYISLMSVSRIYLGHHWLSDVIGGLALGAGSGVICQYILCIFGKKIFCL